MKKISILALTVLFSFGLFFLIKNNSKTSEIEKLRENHSKLIKNHPFSKTSVLSRDERKSLGLPPDAYYEQEYLLEMNPKTGRTEPEKLLAIQEELNNNSNTKDIPGGAVNAWEERGPRNAPGRTRAIMYDPNDATHKRVFAGGVSGGLWTWENIESGSSLWQRVGIPENLAVSSITYDPNNTQNMFVGTGESYVGGLGNGIWRSTDGGVTWEHVFGGSTGSTYTNGDATITVNSPASIAGEYMAIRADFGAESTATITSDLVLVEDGSGNNEACNAITNAAAINGHIAVIERGNCEFGSKILKAENAGATAVLMINNVAGTPIQMAPGVDGAAVTIPAVMISVIEGGIILNAMASGTVNVDFDLDTDNEPVGTLVPGTFHVNDIRAWDNGGSTELFAAISDAFSEGATMGPGTFGLYKSTDNGDTWNKLNLPQTTEGNDMMPNDIEFGADNKIWIATANSRSFGNGGGNVLNSTDGINFSLLDPAGSGHTIPGGADRVEIALSASDPDKIYILVEHNSVPVLIFKSTDGLATNPSNKSLPDVSDDSTVPNNDFTRGQAWYDLMIAVDPNNDEILYVGGVDSFRSEDGANSWIRMTKWASFIPKSVPLTHADQHELVFHPTDSNRGLMATDGGVFYATSFSAAVGSPSAIIGRKIDYNTTQFYNAGYGQSTTNEKLLAGAQDNGSFYKTNAASGINMMTEIRGGDGMLCFIDKDEQYIVVSNPGNNFYRHSIGGSSQATLVAQNTEGNFVNPAELDDNMEILYTNGTNATTLRITRVLNVDGTPSRSYLTDDLLLGVPTAFKVSPYTTVSSKLFVGTSRGNLFRLDNANATPTWTKITGPEFFGSISAINFGENENEIMVTFHNYGTTNIWYTNNGGSTWQNKEGDFPDLPIKAIMMNPLLDNEVIIGTSLGVWYTANFNDASPNWLRAHNGMQNVKVTGFDLRTADNKVLAATYGRGLFTGYFNSSPAGVDETNNLTSAINIYPTLVTNGSITIESVKQFGKTNLGIYDMQGKQVLSQKIELNASKNTIAINLNSGIYILKLEANGLTSSTKIIVQ
ncbi:MAG TPA: T9SS type A sorting domain-containing protein [Lutibacter sp.]|nr:T9SS type A sorting domain-containing protein [Lutibacter sp.]